MGLNVGALSPKRWDPSSSAEMGRHRSWLVPAGKRRLGTEVNCTPWFFHSLKKASAVSADAQLWSSHLWWARHAAGEPLSRLAMCLELPTTAEVRPLSCPGPRQLGAAASIPACLPLLPPSPSSRTRCVVLSLVFRQMYPEQCLMCTV